MRATTNFRDDKFLTKFGNKVKALRKSQGLSQEELSYKTGFELSQIGRIERAEINTSLSHLSAIAKAFKIEPKELLEF